MSHLLALQSLCGRIHPSARKMLKVFYWRAPEVSTHVLPLLGVCRGDWERFLAGYARELSFGGYLVYGWGSAELLGGWMIRWELK